MPKISTHLGYFGSGGDRYNLAGYRKADSPIERIRLASTVSGLSGIELNYPALVNESNAEEVRSALKQGHLVVCNVSLNVWGEGKWGWGSLSSADPAIRRAAIDTLKRGIAVSKSVGSPLVSLWPGQDGFDYPFQVDYATTMDWFVKGMQEVAAFDPEMRICLEYKAKEPRCHLLVDSAARTMWMIGKIGAPNVGVLLDVGHAFLSYENPAQSAVLLQQEGLLDLVHFNDNYGEWDWDMIPGTLRFWENIELIFWLRECRYDKWYSIDIAMPRGDPVKAALDSVKNIQGLYVLAGKLDHKQVLANLGKPGHPDNLRLVWEQVLGVQ